MTNEEKIQYMCEWVNYLKEKDPGKNCKKIEVLKYAIKECVKAENRKERKRENSNQ